MYKNTAQFFKGLRGSKLTFNVKITEKLALTTSRRKYHGSWFNSQWHRNNWAVSRHYRAPQTIKIDTEVTIKKKLKTVGDKNK